MVERHDVRIGRTGQGASDAGGQQDDISGHEPDSGAAGDVQPCDGV
jgi:hypothetical protein